MEESKNLKIALLIDAENISQKYIKLIFDELSNYGTATSKRIYGDWTSAEMKTWKDALLENGLMPIQTFQNTSGKNSTDSALIIDAMDILFSKNVDAFCIISSDSDFTRLIARLREDGKFVLGMGEKKTPQSLIKVCDKFIYLDVDKEEKNYINKKSEEKDKTENRAKNTFIRKKLPPIEPEKIVQLEKIIDESCGENDWANLGEVGNRMQKLFPDFEAKNYGYKKLSDLLQNYPQFIIDIRPIKDNPNGKNIYIKNKIQ